MGIPLVNKESVLLHRRGIDLLCAKEA